LNKIQNRQFKGNYLQLYILDFLSWQQQTTGKSRNIGVMSINLSWMFRDTSVNNFIWISCTKNAVAWGRHLTDGVRKAKTFNIYLDLIILVILRAVTVVDFIASWFWSRARRWNRRIASYVTVSAKQLSAKIGHQKTATVAVWRIWPPAIFIFCGRC